MQAKKTILIIALYFSSLCSAQTGQTTAVILDSFNTGQVSPRLEARQDFAKYNSACRTLENFLISPLGPVQRRPGTKYIATAKTGTPRLIKFEYSTDDVYAIEMGDQYMRFYREGGQILDPNNDPYEILTPYDANEIWNVRYAQSDNWMYLVNSTDPPQILTRTGHAAWTITEIDFEGGPFLDENDDKTSTITPSWNTGDYNEVAVSGDAYATDDIGQGNFYSTKYHCQTFTASETYNISSVGLKLWKSGNPGTVYVSIQTTASGKPTGTELCSGTISASDITTDSNGAWEKCAFSTFPAITSGTVYAIVAKQPSGNQNNPVYWREANPGSFSGGSYGITYDAGASWTMYDVADFMFKVYKTTDYEAGGITPGVTLTASKAIFNANHVGALWQITHFVPGDSISGRFWTSGNSMSSTIRIWEGQQYTVTTGGDWFGTFIIERSYDDGNTWEEIKRFSYRGNGNVLWNGIENEDDAFYRMRMEDQYVTSHMLRHSEGECDYTLATDPFYRHGIVEITAVADAQHASATEIVSLALTDTTWRWAEGAWSDYRGYPKTVAFHQQRAVFGGSDSYPTALWFSGMGADYYTDMEAGTLDTSAFWVQLQGQNPIRWLLSGDYLLIGTSRSVGKYGKQGLPITPTMPSYVEQSAHGSAPIQAVMTADSVLYVERGARKIREFGYNLQYDRYTTPDLTVLSEEITDPCVIEIAFQTRPQPMLWCVLGDGELATLCYQREHAIIGWSKQNTSGEFKSIVATPGAGTTPAGDRWFEDMVWAVSERTIDGNDYSFIEHFAPLEWGTDPNYCWFVDSGLMNLQAQPDANYYAGLSHLAGKTVGVYADANSIGNFVVDANGMINIGPGHTTVIAGLNFTSKLETLPLKLPTEITQARISDRKISAVNFDFYKTSYLEYAKGQSATPIVADFGVDHVTSVITFKRLTFPFGSLEKATLYVKSDKPVPLGIRAIIPEITYYWPR